MGNKRNITHTRTLNLGSVFEVHFLFELADVVLLYLQFLFGASWTCVSCVCQSCACFVCGMLGVLMIIVFVDL